MQRPQFVFSYLKREFIRDEYEGNQICKQHDHIPKVTVKKELQSVKPIATILLTSIC